MPPALPQPVADYLDRHHVMTLATCGPDGPWAAAVFYVNAGHSLFFLSAASSRHGRNLAQDPRCAATIQEDYSDWAKIKGVQLEGLASEVPASANARTEQPATGLGGIDSEKRPRRGQFLPDLQSHSPAMGQRDGEEWTATAVLQPMLPKPDSLLAFA